jgi:hypothetical protein
MDGTDGPGESARVAAPIASKELGVKVFTAPKGWGQRGALSFGEGLGLDSIESGL